MTIFQMKLTALIERDDFEAARKNLFSANCDVQAAAVKAMFRALYQNDNMELLFLLESKECEQVVQRMNGLYLLFMAHSLHKEKKFLDEIEYFGSEKHHEREIWEQYEKATMYLRDEAVSIELMKEKIENYTGIKTNQTITHRAEWDFIESMKESLSELCHVKRIEKNIISGKWIQGSFELTSM